MESESEKLAVESESRIHDLSTFLRLKDRGIGIGIGIKDFGLQSAEVCWNQNRNFAVPLEKKTITGLLEVNCTPLQ